MSLTKSYLNAFCHFIDGISVDKYGKLTVEVALTCCIWYNKKARNRASTWWVQGLVQDKKLFRDQKNISTMIEYKTIIIFYPKYSNK